MFHNIIQLTIHKKCGFQCENDDVINENHIRAIQISEECELRKGKFFSPAASQNRNRSKTLNLSKSAVGEKKVQISA